MTPSWQFKHRGYRKELLGLRLAEEQPSVGLCWRLRKAGGKAEHCAADGEGCWKCWVQQSLPCSLLDVSPMLRPSPACNWEMRKGRGSAASSKPVPPEQRQRCFVQGWTGAWLFPADYRALSLGSLEKRLVLVTLNACVSV